MHFPRRGSLDLLDRSDKLLAAGFLGGIAREWHSLHREYPGSPLEKCPFSLAEIKTEVNREANPAHRAILSG
jgi:hypothetical protein